MFNRLQSPCALSDIRWGERNRMNQALGINDNMSFDTRYFLARIVALLFGAIRVLHPLCIKDAKTRFF